MKRIKIKNCKIKLKKDITFTLCKAETEDGICYSLKDEKGEILMNLESSKMLGDRILIMTESFNRKGFDVQFIEK